MSDNDYCYTKAEEQKLCREYHENTTPEERREIEAAVDRAMDRLADRLGYTAEDIADIKAKFETNTNNRQPSEAEDAPQHSPEVNR